LSGVFQGIFGGSKSSSSSGNKAYPWIQDNYGASGASAFNGGTSALEGLLGLGGGDPQALQKFWNSTGGQFLLNQGTNSINSNMYARGLGNSGAAMKSLEGYRQNLASTKLNDLMQNYMGLAKLGLGAGSLVSDAGQYSKSKGTEQTGNAGSSLGALLAFI
jgi:hypothetical protein